MHKYNIFNCSIYEEIYINNCSQNNIENKKQKLKIGILKLRLQFYDIK